MKTLVVGLGNPLLGDDGVGWRIAEQVEKILNSDPAPAGAAALIAVKYLSVGGISLMENLADYDQAIIIDAITTGRNPVGTVTAFPLEALPDLSNGHTTSVHDTSLQTAMKLGCTLGVHLPSRVMVIGIEAQQIYDFSEELTPAVAQATAEAVQMVTQTLSTWTSSSE